MTIALYPLLALLLGGACSESPASSTPPGDAPVTESTPPPGVDESAVEAVVFIGKADSCDCTRERVGSSWAALQAALEGRELPVERIDLDVDEARTNELQALERFFAAPAIYFLDADGGLVRMLQGEVSEEAVREVVGPHP